MSELACQSAAAILVSSEAKDLPVRPDRKGGHLHHRRASLASFPSLQGAIIIKGIEQVFRGFAAHRCWDMGTEEEEPNLSENLLTVREEQLASGTYESRRYEGSAGAVDPSMSRRYTRASAKAVSSATLLVPRSAPKKGGAVVWSVIGP
jgi:hypothetical protein